MIKRPSDWHRPKPWGRHSLILIAAGFAYIFVGVLYIYAPPAHHQIEALVYAGNTLSRDYWGAIFIIVGCIALLSARWPSWPKTLGYTVLTGWSAAWAAFYLIGFLLTDADVASLYVGLIWSLVAFLWWGISGLVSPTEAGDAEWTVAT